MMIEQSLGGLLSQIEYGEIVLPAMQRPFVWSEQRMTRLIDSLLRGFPIGAVMLWKTRVIQRYRRFSCDIDTSVPPVFTFETAPEGSGKYLVLDGQQRLTTLYVALKGSYDHRVLYLNILSGDPADKDPGDEYYESAFLTTKEAAERNALNNGQRVHLVPLAPLTKIQAPDAPAVADQKAKELGLNDEARTRVVNTYVRCAFLLDNKRSMQIIPVDEDSNRPPMPIEEILEIFVRVNSAGLVLQKSDLLMSLLDLKWNDIQPELQELVREVNLKRSFEFKRDDVLKSLLLAEGADTRFDRLVSDRKSLEQLADKLPLHIAPVRQAWMQLGVILTDDCKIYTKRFFKGGHNALQPFVLFLSNQKSLGMEDRRKIRLGIYIALMSGIFGSAEARMGMFCRKTVARAASFPLKELCALIRGNYGGIMSLQDLLRCDRDLALNIAHGGITIDESNPDALQRDHIFPRSKLEAVGYPPETVNHYANFHFLRGSDNLNKSATPPHEWFKEPGKGKPSYTDQDLKERLLTWEDLAPGNFENMIKVRSQKIKKRAEEILGYSEAEIDAFLSGTAV